MGYLTSALRSIPDVAVSNMNPDLVIHCHLMIPENAYFEPMRAMSFVLVNRGVLKGLSKELKKGPLGLGLPGMPEEYSEWLRSMRWT